MADQPLNLFEDFPEVPTSEWLAKIEKDLKGKSLDSLDWSPEEGIDLKPFYRKEDIDSINLPSFAKTNNQWLVRERIEIMENVAACKQANKVLLDALNGGLQAPDFEIDNLIDKKNIVQLLKDVQVEILHLFFRGLMVESEPMEVLSFVHGAIKAKGVNPRICKGGIHLDPLGYFVENGEFYTDENLDMMNLMDAIDYAQRQLSNFTVINVSTMFLQGQGSTASQQLAIAMATGSEYLAQLTEMGLDVDVINKHMQFEFSVGGNYFLEIAKMRAMKILWLNILEAYGSKNPTLPHIHIQTALSTQTDDKHTNMIRSTTEAMSGILAGADSITVFPADTVYGEPDDFSRRVARNVQHILKYESKLDWVSDPAAGSYYIETLTSKLADKAYEKFQKIEAAGGLMTYLSA